MEKKKWYSPQLERGLVHLLYLEAKMRRIPMTRLANELIRAALEAARSQRARLLTCTAQTAPGGNASDTMRRTIEDEFGSRPDA